MKKFKEFLIEMSKDIDGVEFSFSNHFIQRMKDRNELSPKNLDRILKLIKKKLKNLSPDKKEYLFYSRYLKQGIIAEWDVFRNRVRLITFLPRNSDLFDKDKTEKIFIESIEKELNIIYVDI